MESCQQLERGATLPAYKHHHVNTEHSILQKLAAEFSWLASLGMKEWPTMFFFPPSVDNTVDGANEVMVLQQSEVPRAYLMM